MKRPPQPAPFSLPPPYALNPPAPWDSPVGSDQPPELMAPISLEPVQRRSISQRLAVQPVPMAATIAPVP
ncbi:MAG: hypothetical protein FWG16_08365, partial [Micrococcales bacterium]|nr:hypothetical protein [Micrococcales bacterium]